MKFISLVLGTIAEKGINVDMISQTAPFGGKTDVSFTVSDENLGQVLEAFGQLRSEYPGIKSDISGGNYKISFFGEEMRYLPGVAAKVFDIISGMKTDVIIITTSEIDISLLIPKADFQVLSSAFEKAFGMKIVK